MRGKGVRKWDRGGGEKLRRVLGLDRGQEDGLGGRGKDVGNRRRSFNAPQTHTDARTGRREP